jgi:low affinity Fe/Cu permease
MPKDSTSNRGRELAAERQNQAAETTTRKTPKSGWHTARVFSDMAQIASREAGRPWVFASAVVMIVLWGGTGPFFKFSDTWQLVINTGTTIITFLMVFLIQNSQNRDAAAIQLKLDELIRVSKARNLFVGVEHLTAQELEQLRQQCEATAKAKAARKLASKKTNSSSITT